MILVMWYRRLKFITTYVTMPLVLLLVDSFLIKLHYWSPKPWWKDKRIGSWIRPLWSRNFSITIDGTIEWGLVAQNYTNNLNLAYMQRLETFGWAQKGLFCLFSYSLGICYWKHGQHVKGLMFLLLVTCRNNGGIYWF